MSNFCFISFPNSKVFEARKLAEVRKSRYKEMTSGACGDKSKHSTAVSRVMATLIDQLLTWEDINTVLE
jgi:hypothetical protein